MSEAASGAMPLRCASFAKFSAVGKEWTRPEKVGARRAAQKPKDFIMDF